MPSLWSPEREGSQPHEPDDENSLPQADVETIPSNAPKGRQLRAGKFKIRVSPVRNREEYEELAEEIWVDQVLDVNHTSQGKIVYTVKNGTGHEVQIPSSPLLNRPNGQEALNQFNRRSTRLRGRRNLQPRASTSSTSDSEDYSDRSTDSDMLSTSHQRQAAAKRVLPGYVDSSMIPLSSDEERESEGRAAKNRKGRRKSRGRSRQSSVAKKRKSRGRQADSDETSEGDDTASNKRPKGRLTRSMGEAPKSMLGHGHLPIDDDEDGAARGSSEGSPPMVRSNAMSKRGEDNNDDQDNDVSTDDSPIGGARRSRRVVQKLKSLKERGEDDIPDMEQSVKAPPRAVGAREKFKELPRRDEFRLVHCQNCDTCGDFGESDDKGPLIFCQGCTSSYHRACLGYRSQREHLVTKVGDEDFVLQCRRCVNAHLKKDPLAPRLDVCQVCEEQGSACTPFRHRMTAKQEEKDREENNGEDPIVQVDPDLINNVYNVLFRCTECHRPFHFAHLPPREQEVDMSGRSETIEDLRFTQYCQDWACFDCLSNDGKVQTLVAWRPKNLETYRPGDSVDMVPEDDKEYLIKWEKCSYFQATWMPGAWVWGVTAAAMRKAFAKRYDGYNLPKMTSEDAIPEEYLRVDIVLDVKYTSVVSVRSETIDRARIKEIAHALVKFKGLGYEEVVWEKPPKPNSGERWTDFVSAYEDWVLGRYVHLPKQHFLKERLLKARKMDFEGELMKKEQPETLTGGTMMEYQLEGLNWLLYKWYKQHNGILADEMGLGKTIQVIGLLSALVHDHKCWPFLVVVPNSTCLNWRREIKRWAPHLRAVSYYGSAEARRLAKEYEMFPNGGRDLQCHVVITSYEVPVDENSRKVLKDIPWAGLIVDEGQRLKNDKNLLYEALQSLKAPFKVLMTGTPLQNNTRELFNLLQFLDKNYKAEELEVQFAVLDAETVSRLHEMIRPFFLRRTKAQVLTFLPPMAQIIVPVTMSVLQKKLYKSILAKNPELIKSIFGRRPGHLKNTERSNLNNLLMQLRKCLCHPFVYSKLIEERSGNAAVSHRTLVEASSKLQLLELMLPALQERGHRVLIFSQFLEMLDIIEDFLDGLQLPFQRLDGSIGSLEKQKRIDEFNAPNSKLFAFLLSTRAGGVGINLATADTVIIMDPDFNPHQDIQALSRAHRIGQKKKVLVFQLMTRDSAEEKIMQIGRKKMALDHVLIDKMGEEDEAGLDVQSILKHGASALFNDDDDQERQIRYDAASIEKLLDRSQAESTKTGADNSAESQFSFARVWANDQSELQEGLAGDGEETPAVDESLWDKLLQERAREAEIQRAAAQQTFGRGKRLRQTVNYDIARRQEQQHIGSDPVVAGKNHQDEDVDTDFQTTGADGEDEETEEDEDAMDVEGDSGLVEVVGELGELGHDPQVGEKNIRGIASTNNNTTTTPAQGFLPPPPPIQNHRKQTSTNINKSVVTSTSSVNKSHHHQPAPTLPTTVQGPLPHHPWPPMALSPEGIPQEMLSVIQTRVQSESDGQATQCPACLAQHALGSCPLKLRGFQLCPLCGLAHFGAGPKCPHLQSETQIRTLMEAIKNSVESKDVKDQAMTYLRGVKGAIVVRAKKEARKMEMMVAQKANGPSAEQGGGGVRRSSSGLGDTSGMDISGISGNELGGNNNTTNGGGGQEEMDIDPHDETEAEVGVGGYNQVYEAIRRSMIEVGALLAPSPNRGGSGPASATRTATATIGGGVNNNNKRSYATTGLGQDDTGSGDSGFGDFAGNGGIEMPGGELPTFPGSTNSNKKGRMSMTSTSGNHKGKERERRKSRDHREKTKTKTKEKNGKDGKARDKGKDKDKDKGKAKVPFVEID
ncbi:MAG: hypothetical protein M1823_000625 [Watsoniomyces obsoletus]|nr:MAG: hypothetical protein M1823_000625 [Watsoniomyces obsoletus]